MNHVVGSHDIYLLTLDTLRYDVAQQQWAAGLTPNLQAQLPASGWERRHSPGNFTYASHAAMFAGFLPTPASPGPHPRLFALAFPGSETTAKETATFATGDIVSGLATHRYSTWCLGGVGFFNQQTPLGCQLPNLFQHAEWQPDWGVTAHHGLQQQLQRATAIMQTTAERLFLFINIASLHQPNRHYLQPAPPQDNLASHAAALRYVDSQLPLLFNAIQQRGPALIIICSDHGTTYGEDGYHGHRLSHENVWMVPYSHFLL